MSERLIDILTERYTPGIRRELWNWCLAAVTALAVAGVFALLVAFSRVPGIQDVFPWLPSFFEKGLVAHVTFSFVVWFLAVFGAILNLATAYITGGRPWFRLLGPAALILLWAGFFLLLASGLLGRGEPSLNNYIPAISDPLYYAGIIALFSGVALEAVRLLVNLPNRIHQRKSLGPLTFGAVAAAVIYLVALACFLLAWSKLRGSVIDYAFNEDLFWGGGHVLQFLNTALMVICWYMLGVISFGASLGSRRLYVIAVGLLAVFAMLAPSFYFISDILRQPEFTDLQYALAPPTILAAGAVLIGLWDRKKDKRPMPRYDPAFLCLALSICVFGLGGFLGLFVDGADTRTPAHYHGVIAGINLAFMGIFHRLFLPLLRYAPARGKALYAQIWMFGLGQALASLGLFIAGGYGTPRKMAGAEQGLVMIGQKAGMFMNGIGALIAVIGGAIFIWMMIRRLVCRPTQEDAASCS